MGDEINNKHDLDYKSILSNKKNFIKFVRSFFKKDWVDINPNIEGELVLDVVY